MLTVLFKQLYDNAKSAVEEFKRDIVAKIKELDDQKSNIDSLEVVVRSHRNSAAKCKDHVSTNVLF